MFSLIIPLHPNPSGTSQMASPQLLVNPKTNLQELFHEVTFRKLRKSAIIPGGGTLNLSIGVILELALVLVLGWFCVGIGIGIWEPSTSSLLKFKMCFYLFANYKSISFNCISNSNF